MDVRRTRTIPRTHVRIGRSSAGLGLFATSRIEPGQYLEYTGTLYRNEAILGWKTKYLFEVNARWTIDGSARTNLARYINHQCARANCESVLASKRVFIKARRVIQPGEELTYDYGKEYVDEFIKPYGCKCKGCRDKALMQEQVKMQRSKGKSTAQK